MNRTNTFLQDIKKTEMSIQTFTKEEKENFIAILESKYFNPKYKHQYHIHDRFDVLHSIAVDDNKAYVWMKEFLKDYPLIIVFFHPSFIDAVFEITDPCSFIDLYMEHYLLDEIYICDSELNFVICFNEYGWVQTLGEAANWLERDGRYLKWYEKNL